MKRLLQLQHKKASAVAEARAYLDGCGDSLTAEQEAKHAELMAGIEALDAQIKREQVMAAAEASVTGPATVTAPTPNATAVQADLSGSKTRSFAAAGVADNINDTKFSSFGEYMSAVANAYRVGVIDHRLYGASGASEGAAPDGGFAVGVDFQQQIVEPLWNAPDSIAAQCTQLPISASSNGVKIPVVDETSRASSRFGGITGYWLGESATLTSSQPKMAQVEFNLKKVGVLAYITDELLLDAPVLGSFLLNAMQYETRFQVENSILNGTGVGQPLGVINAPALVTQAIEGSQTIANTAGSIVANLTKMLTRLPPRSRNSAVWLYNPDLLPKFITATLGGTAAYPVFLPPGGLAGTSSAFGTLLGIPALPVEYCKAEGTPGDILLCDMSQYGLATKGGPAVAQSMHVKFTTDEMTFRVIYRVDGQPFWRTPTTPFQGSNTRSPFVALATRS